MTSVTLVSGPEIERHPWGRLDLYYHLRERFLGEPVPSNLELAASEEWPTDGAD